MNEVEALEHLITAADGRATAEPVVALAVAVLSPWAGDRRGVIDRPDKAAPSVERPLFAFLESVQTKIAPDGLPQDSGVLAWLRHHGRALPVRDIDRGPAWLTSPLLADGWISLPPAGRFSGVDNVIAVDGRLACLHQLALQAGPGSRAAVVVLTEWLVGIRSADWSTVAADQCPAMAITSMRRWAWWSTVQALPVGPVVDQLTGPALISPSWEVPPPTAAELAAEAERLRILADGKRAAQEWDVKYRNGRAPVTVR